MKSDKTRINFYIPNKIIEQLDKEAKERSMSRTAVLLNILDTYTRQQEMILTLQDMVKLAKLDKK